MNAELETVACPLCGSERWRPKLRARDRFGQNFEPGFQIVRCADCDFVFLNPRPTGESIARFYESSEYDPFLSTQAQPDLWSRLYFWVRNFMVRRKRAWIEKLKPPGSLLDIGCGTGEFIHEMQTHGWSVTGVETDEAAADFARKEYDLEVKPEACDFEMHQFDVVTFWHALEHVFDPVQTLRKVDTILKPDGIVFIAVPNIASVDAGFYKENWVALDAPRHLVHFTPDSMSRLAAAAKFSILRFRQMPLDAFYNCLMSERLTQERGKKGKGLMPFYLLRGLALAVGSIILASRILRRKRTRGSSMLYILKKRELK